MNPKLLLTALLPGLIPVLVFVAVDALFGEIVGCIVGLAVGIGELALSLVRNRAADPFLILDTALLAAACGLSLLLKNEVFFKMKPAVIEAVFCIGLAAFLVLPPSALKGYVARHVRGIEIPDSTVPAMQRSLGLMVGVMVLHMGLTVWAALALSTAAWGFISGALLYILFGVAALAQLIGARRARAGRGTRARAARRGPRASDDSLPVIDEEGKIIDLSPRAECHQGPGKMHPAVRLVITDGTGRLYLQKRPASSAVDPDRWETAVAAHVPAGESLDAALARELGRQLGIMLPPPGSGRGSPRLLLRYKWEDAAETELVFAFLLQRAEPITPNSRAVTEARFWPQEEIRRNLGMGVFTPRLEFELGLIERAAAEAGNRG
jgi:isopentenyldiphosphate isomerase/intracellular septation protein A